MTAPPSAYLVVKDGRLVGIGLPAEVARAYLRPELLAGVKMNEHHDERGRFASGGSGGGLHSNIGNFEQSIASNRTEGGAIFSSAGEMLNEGNQTGKHSVRFTIDRASAKDAILTHNHPNSGSFSVEDVTVAAHYDLSQLRVVTKAQVYSMDRPAAGWPDARPNGALQRTIMRHQSTVREELAAKVQSGELPLNRSNQVYWQTVWTRVSADLGIPYHEDTR